MMGERRVDQAKLFYEFSLDRRRVANLAIYPDINMRNIARVEMRWNHGQAGSEGRRRGL